MKFKVGDIICSTKFNDNWRVEKANPSEGYQLFSFASGGSTSPGLSLSLIERLFYKLNDYNKFWISFNEKKQ